MRCPARGSRRVVVPWFNSDGPRCATWPLKYHRGEKEKAFLPRESMYEAMSVVNYVGVHATLTPPSRRHGRHHFSNQARAGLRSFARRSGVRDRFMRLCPSGKRTQAELTRPVGTLPGNVRNDGMCDEAYV